ncbi:MAG: molybdopterin-guanine dinucleotide biosynthesis protein MobB [Thermoanaerobaculia bacterium]
MRPLAFIGYSGSGKTTQIVRLIRRFAAAGEGVAVIKHTHHTANAGRRGDTGRFLDAGAAETILASEDGVAAHSSGEMFPWRDPRALLSRVAARRIFLEGFAESGVWPSILVEREDRGSPDTGGERLVATISDRPGNGTVPRFGPDDEEAIAAFVDGVQREMGSRWEGIVFDLDGTLIDSYRALAGAINHARRAAGLPALGEEAIRAAVGEGVEVLLERTFAPGPVPGRAREDFESHYDAICCEESRLLEHVGETLAALQAQGIRMGVCTNKPTSFSAKILRYLGLEERFGAIVGPDLAGARKPDGRHVVYTLRAIARGADESLFVGDMPVDVAAARSAGVPVAVLATGSSPRPALAESRPDFLLERFDQLVALAARRES